MGIQVDFPYPLRNCPSRPRWQQRRGSQYLVFVDESTNRFFNLDSHYGYFCHAAVGIPENEYQNVVARMAPVFDQYRGLVGQGETEFKHSEFRRLPFRDRSELAASISGVLRDTGGFVSAFYTPTESFILERVRWNLVGDADAVPDDYEALYLAAAAELRAEDVGEGRSVLISKLLHLPVQAILSMLGEFQCTFRALYDPREKREDRAVAHMVDGYVRTTQSAAGAAIFGGISVNRTSDQEIGLQLADLVVGEVRDFFAAQPMLLRHGAMRQLITPWSEEPIQTVIATPRGPAKTGVLTTLPADVRAPLTELQDGGSVFPRYAELFASGIVTCYSALGTARDILIFENQIWDQADLDLLVMLLTLRDAKQRKNDAGRAQ